MGKIWWKQTCPWQKEQDYQYPNILVENPVAGCLRTLVLLMLHYWYLNLSTLDASDNYRYSAIWSPIQIHQTHSLSLRMPYSPKLCSETRRCCRIVTRRQCYQWSRRCAEDLVHTEWRWHTCIVLCSVISLWAEQSSLVSTMMQLSSSLINSMTDWGSWAKQSDPAGTNIWQSNTI